MTRPKPLFIMGNKRSGSTLMTDLLNSHANVFVSHESDIAWILYQARAGRPARYQTHTLAAGSCSTPRSRAAGAS